MHYEAKVSMSLTKIVNKIGPNMVSHSAYLFAKTFVNKFVYYSVCFMNGIFICRQFTVIWSI